MAIGGGIDYEVEFEILRGKGVDGMRVGEGGCGVNPWGEVGGRVWICSSCM